MLNLHVFFSIDEILAFRSRKTPIKRQHMVVRPFSCGFLFFFITLFFFFQTGTCGANFHPSLFSMRARWQGDRGGCCKARPGKDEHFVEEHAS